MSRLLALFGGRRDEQVLVLVNTVNGVKAVPVRARDLRWRR